LAVRRNGVKSKLCPTCSECKPLDSYHKHSRTKDGLYYQCKVCKAAFKKESYSRIKVKHLRSCRKYYKENRDNILVQKVQYYESNKDACIERSAKRRARKLKATPPWLTEEHIKEIKNFYWLAQDLKLVTGETYHVDHIVPLKGKSVCGLHVPWNLQILPADINLSKGNHYANDA